MILLNIVLAVIVAVILFLVVNYLLSTNRNHIKISFDKFLNLYNINKDKWTLNRSYNEAVYTIPPTDKHSFSRYSFGKEVCFRFGLIDFYKYKFFSYNEKHDNLNANKNKKLAEVLEDIQKDITEYREKLKEDTTNQINKIVNEDNRNDKKKSLFCNLCGNYYSIFIESYTDCKGNTYNVCSGCRYQHYLVFNAIESDPDSVLGSTYKNTPFDEIFKIEKEGVK